MQSGRDVPLTNNPLFNTVFGTNDDNTQMTEKERQRESEVHLLGTMLFQALLLAICLLLYNEWTWSHFDSPYQSAIFYGFAAFSVQASFYFSWRAVLEDSASHRRQLKRMRNTNRRALAQIKFEQERAQLEMVLNQQLNTYQQNLQIAMSDNYISPNEQNMLMNQEMQMQALAAQIQALGGEAPNLPSLQPQGAAPIVPTAQSMGIDRHRVMGIPLGPSLTLNPLAVPTTAPAGTSTELGNSNNASQQQNLDLTPSGTQEQQVAAQAETMEKAVESL